MSKLDAIIFVKVLEQGFQILQNSSVPLIWDHVDEWDGGSLGPVLQFTTCVSKSGQGGHLHGAAPACFVSPGAGT